MSLKNPNTTIDRLAAYRKAVEKWKRDYNEKINIHSMAKTQDEKPTIESCQPEKCEPKDFGLTDSTQFLTDQIRKQVLGI